MLLVGAAVFIGVLALGGAHQSFWCIDDLEGYMAMARKALQTHSIQPDFFCERRVQAGVGGGNFLDSWMLAGGDLRAMPFIDSSLGLVLYALSVWSLGRRWKVPLTGIGVVLFCLPLATLMKVNLTIIYLSAAAFLVVMYLLAEAFDKEDRSFARFVVIGIIVGAACTTKTTNVTLVVPLLLGSALLCKLFNSRTKVWSPLVIIFLTAGLVAAPYVIQNKRTAGTYLYPLFGLGIHVSAYHLIPVPSRLGIPEQLLVLLLPTILMLALLLICLWKLTLDWSPGSRATLLAYMGSAIAAISVSTYGLGGSGADRYTAPFAMPALLMTALVTFRVAEGRQVLWRKAAVVSLAISAVYVVLFVGFKLRWYDDTRNLGYEAIGMTPPGSNFYMKFVPKTALSDGLAYGSRIQSVLPEGATAIADMASSYIFDFGRNRIYIQDMAGMASPQPGMPLTEGPDGVRRFLLDQGISYVIFDKRTKCPPLHWDDFLKDQHEHFPRGAFLKSPLLAHHYETWSHVEGETACHERSIVYEIAERGQVVYDDGRVTVSRITF